MSERSSSSHMNCSTHCNPELTFKAFVLYSKSFCFQRQLVKRNLSGGKSYLILYSIKMFTAHHIHWENNGRYR